MSALDPILELALRGSLGALFAGSALHKLRHPAAFAGVVGAYGRGLPLQSRAVVHLVAGLVVALEAALAVSALTAPAALLGLAAAGLLGAYAAAMAANLTRGNRLLDCGCAWGDERQPVGWALVLRNLVLAAAAAPLMLPPASRVAGLPDVLSGLAGAVLILLAYLIANQLIRNDQQLKAAAR